MNINVYRLAPFHFGKNSERFVRSNPRTFPEFHPDQIIAPKNWTAPRLAATWKVQRLAGNVSPENDFPCEGVPADFIPVFSSRAVEGLHDFLEPNGELLPVLTPLGKYYAYNVTAVVDPSDLRKSTWLPLGHDLDVIVFRPDTLKRLNIFKIPQTPMQVYVTEPFVRRVRELGLSGMWFTKVWPMPKGVRWQNERGKELRRQRVEAEAKIDRYHFPKLKAANELRDFSTCTKMCMRLRCCLNARANGQSAGGKHGWKPASPSPRSALR